MLVPVVALLILQATPPWERDWPSDMAWAQQTTAQDRFWFKAEDLTRGSGAGFTVWLHGEHSRNPNVTYRESLWRFYFDCKGTITLTASTTFDADGRSKSWDGLNTSHIRPGTMYQDIEKKFCT